MSEDLETLTPTRRGRPPVNTVASPTRPGWKPAARMGGVKAPKGFTARWVADEPDNIARKKEEGWVMLPADKNQKDFDVKDVNDGNKMGSNIHYRGMVAMMLPDDKKEARTEYYKAETNRATQMIMKKTDGEAKNMGVQTYAPKGQGGRIVIE